MHSSRMRTAHLLTISQLALGQGGVCIPACIGQGMSAQGSVCILSRGGGCLPHTPGQAPREQNDSQV